MAADAPLFTKNTYVHGHGWFGPDHPGSEVTPEVEAAVRKARGQAEPEAEVGTQSDDGQQGGPPPKAGAGATTEAWAEYARANDVQVPDEYGRADIIAALETAGVPTDAD